MASNAAYPPYLPFVALHHSHTHSEIILVNRGAAPLADVLIKPSHPHMLTLELLQHRDARGQPLTLPRTGILPYNWAEATVAPLPDGLLLPGEALVLRLSARCTLPGLHTITLLTHARAAEEQPYLAALHAADPSVPADVDIDSVAVRSLLNADSSASLTRSLSSACTVTRLHRVSQPLLVLPALAAALKPIPDYQALLDLDAAQHDLHALLVPAPAHRDDAPDTDAEANDAPVPADAPVSSPPCPHTPHALALELVDLRPQVPDHLANSVRTLYRDAPVPSAADATLPAPTYLYLLLSHLLSLPIRVLAAHAVDRSFQVAPLAALQGHAAAHTLPSRGLLTLFLQAERREDACDVDVDGGEEVKTDDELASASDNALAARCSPRARALIARLRTHADALAAAPRALLPSYQLKHLAHLRTLIALVDGLGLAVPRPAPHAPDALAALVSARQAPLPELSFLPLVDDPAAWSSVAVTPGKPAAQISSGSSPSPTEAWLQQCLHEEAVVSEAEAQRLVLNPSVAVANHALIDKTQLFVHWQLEDDAAAAKGATAGVTRLFGAAFIGEGREWVTPTPPGLVPTIIPGLALPASAPALALLRLPTPEAPAPICSSALYPPQPRADALGAPAQQPALRQLLYALEQQNTLLAPATLRAIRLLLQSHADAAGVAMHLVLPHTTRVRSRWQKLSCDNHAGVPTSIAYTAADPRPDYDALTSLAALRLGTAPRSLALKLAQCPVSVSVACSARVQHDFRRQGALLLPVVIAIKNMTSVPVALTLHLLSVHSAPALTQTHTDPATATATARLASDDDVQWTGPTERRIARLGGRRSVVLRARLCVQDPGVCDVNQLAVEIVSGGAVNAVFRGHTPFLVHVDHE
jgi:hypothetical protein